MNAAHTASTRTLFATAAERFFIVDGTRSLERQHLASLLAGHWGVIGDAAFPMLSFHRNRTAVEIKTCAAACRDAAAFLATMHLATDEVAELAADLRNGLFMVVDRCREQMEKKAA